MLEITVKDMSGDRAIRLLTEADNNEKALRKSLMHLTVMESRIRELEWMNERLIIGLDTARRDASMATKIALLLRKDIERLTNIESAGGVK